MAFWKFGKKESTDNNKKIFTAIDIGSFLIDFQLKTVGSTPGFDELFHSPFVRGYFVGVFSGAMQAFKIDGYGDDVKTMAFLVGGHVALIGEKHGFTYAMDSLKFQGHKDYDLGNRLGGQEIIAFFNKEIVVPRQLRDYIIGN
ncbi:hypothetical protein [Pseudomonas paracarnis]|uniref:Uncharacterized protein n=1 Tax=Pseudomonas paracarnis TaxID=2750625 RepID=A0ABU6BY01_9PSED|nr:hypothetical protein [Pseudomonas paracarnis]MBW9242150.1 hypothetical protein [Pseudomonas paracarnis]MEB3784943.1 hypothetical protein [Pseudomonas paracarnis]